MRAIDTHVHVNFPEFQGDLDTVRQRWLAAGVVASVHSCVSPAEFGTIAAIADRYPEVFCAVGLHPLEAERQWQPDLGEAIAHCADGAAKLVAIGETGLDFFKSEAHTAQFAALEAQLDLACDRHLPVILHCRDAARPLAEYLRSRRDRLPRGVMHCWGGSPEETGWFLDLGFYISFSGTVTFKKATAIQESAQIVPEDRLLVETDCPFLAPGPHRGKRNEPAYVVTVLDQVATLRQTDPVALAEQTSTNAIALFALPPLAELVQQAAASVSVP